MSQPVASTGLLTGPPTTLAVRTWPSWLKLVSRHPTSALALPAPTVIAAVTDAAASVANTGRRFISVLALFVLVLITSLFWLLVPRRTRCGRSYLPWPSPSGPWGTGCVLCY